MAVASPIDGLGASPQQCADDVRAVVRDVLSDASTRGLLQTASATAGWKNGFFLAAADGNYNRTIQGSRQIRFAFDHRDSSTEINLRRQCH